MKSLIFEGRFVTAAGIAFTHPHPSSVKLVCRTTDAHERTRRMPSETLGSESPLPHKRSERGPYLPLLLCGFNEIIYLESTPGAVKGISDVSYI